MSIDSYSSNILICTVKYKVCLYVRWPGVCPIHRLGSCLKGSGNVEYWLGLYSITAQSSDPRVHSGPRLVSRIDAID